MPSVPPDISRIEYSAFNKIGDKRFPFEVLAFRDRAVVLTVKVRCRERLGGLLKYYERQAA